MAKKWITEEEFLKMQKGGSVEPIYTDDPNDPRIKSYQDSLKLFNTVKYNQRSESKGSTMYPTNKPKLTKFIPYNKLPKNAVSPGNSSYFEVGDVNFGSNDKLKIDNDGFVSAPDYSYSGWIYDKDQYSNKINPNIKPIGFNKYELTHPNSSEKSNTYSLVYQKPKQPVKFKVPMAGNINIRANEWEYGGSAEQDGGDQVSQLIQAYAQKIGMDPQELVSKLKGLQPEEQQQALQQMQQELQVEGQGMAVGGYIDEDYNQMFQKQQYLPQLPYGPKLNTEPSTNNWYQPGASTKATQAMGAIGNIMTPDMMNKMQGMMGSMNNASKSNMNMAKAMAEPGINLDSYSKFQGQYGDPSSDYWDKYMEQKETMAKFQPGINRIPKQNTGIGINMENVTSTYDFNDKVATKNSGMSGTSGIAGSGLQEAAKTGMSKKVSDPLGMAGDLVQGFGSNLAAMGDSSKPGVAGVQGAFKAMEMAKPFTKMLPPGVKQGVNAAIALIGGPLALVNAKIQKEQLDEAEAKNAHSDRMLQVMDSQLGEGVAFSEYGNNFGVKNLDQRITDEIFSDFDKYLLNINKKN